MHHSQQQHLNEASTIKMHYSTMLTNSHSWQIKSSNSSKSNIIKISFTVRSYTTDQSEKRPCVTLEPITALVHFSNIYT